MSKNRTYTLLTDSLVAINNSNIVFVLFMLQVHDHLPTMAALPVPTCKCILSEMKHQKKRRSRTISKDVFAFPGGSANHFLITSRFLSGQSSIVLCR
jgi:hypothetical protein